MIRLYFKCGRPEHGHLLFERMPNRSVVTWNCVIAGFAELRRWEEVKSLFWLMVEELGGVPSSFALVTMLTTCARSGDLQMGENVHRCIVDCGVGFCLEVWNALMNMYTKLGEMETAHALFRQMPYKDVVSWTTMVSGYAAQRRLEVARGIFDEMPVRNVVAWNAMIAGCVINNSFLEALVLFEEMMVLGINPDQTTLISVFSACGHLADLKMGRVLHGYTCKAGTNMSLELSNSMLSMYVKSSCIRSSEIMFRRMSTRDEISLTLMMEIYVNHGMKDVAIKIFDQMAYKDLASWNSLLTVLGQCGYYKEAFDIFYQMQRSNVKPNALTLVSMLSASAKVGAIGVGKWIHSYIDRTCMKMDGHLSCALVDMYAKCGCLEDAIEIFNKTKNRDLLAWSAMIGGIATHGEATLAFKLFKEMIGKGLQPDAVAFLGVLTACHHAGLVDEGFEFFNLMTKTYGISPATEHYSCMVNLLASRGHLVEAYNFINNLSHYSVGESAWRALLAACRTHGDVELAEHVANRLVELDPRSSGAYVLLSNTYAGASRWEHVGKMRRMMRTKGVQKVPGWSSVEMDGVVHEFFAGDVDHPRSREIYMTLGLLAKQMKDPRDAHGMESHATFLSIDGVC